LFGLFKTVVTRHSSSLIISHTLGAVWVVEPVRHP